jgi:hypothetical protein
LKNRYGTSDDDWHGFAYPENHTKFEEEKVMVRVNSEKPCFAPDRDSTYCFIGSGGGSGGYGLRFCKRYVITSSEFLYYVALLNSAATEFYNKHVGSILGGKFYMYNQRFLKPIPLRTPSPRLETSITGLASEITAAVEQITELKYKISDISSYHTRYTFCSAILDLADPIELSDDSYRQDSIRTDETADVETSEEVYRVVMKRSHTIGFDSEAVRDFTFELLAAQDRRLSRSDAEHGRSVDRGRTGANGRVRIR